jgi:hypothetical protein
MTPNIKKKNHTNPLWLIVGVENLKWFTKVKEIRSQIMGKTLELESIASSILKKKDL